jgi:membrane-bound serine protease (ClpP class)
MGTCAIRQTDVCSSVTRIKVGTSHSVSRVFGILLMAGLAVTLTHTPACAGEVGLIRIDGAIGPATATYVSRAVDDAARDGDVCLVIQLDTPGGLLESTKEIVEKLLSDEEPTVVYVAPSGGGAASAGTFITLAANVAAMAPNTTIGAAHPVSFGGGSSDETNEVMGKKLENFAVSFIETIASRRHHNAEWAKSAVRDSVSTNSEEALKLKVIDLIAPNLTNLLQQLDGRIIDGKTLRTAQATIVEMPMSARERLFQRLWQPQVMFVLMLVAMYGLIGELSHPGAILPGVVGAVALILVLYMNSILPINSAGLALILLAVALFVIDVFATTHGILTAGGIVAFFLGSLMLFNREPGFSLPLGIILPATVVTAAFFLFVIGAGLRAQFLSVKTGREAMIGRTATALTAIDAQGGRVLLDGENWDALSETPVASGSRAEIVSLEGLTLRVKPKS